MGRLIRSSAWYTDCGCICPYKYTGQTFPANPFPGWMKQWATNIEQLLDMKKWKINGINFNLYDDFSQFLNFHKDDEKLFKYIDNSTFIVSISFGASRQFSIKREFQNDDTATLHTLNHGDILTMQGQMQTFWQHAIVKGNHTMSPEPRVNATLRVVHRHTETKCPCNSTN